MGKSTHPLCLAAAALLRTYPRICVRHRRNTSLYVTNHAIHVDAALSKLASSLEKYAWKVCVTFFGSTDAGES
jgi:hypothetical protein